RGGQELSVVAGKSARVLAIQGYSWDGMVGSAVQGRNRQGLCGDDTVRGGGSQEGRKGSQERRTSRSRPPGRLKARPAWRLHERAASQREVLFAGWRPRGRL
ncbi:hypothetical protein GOP47_0024186, partial [Adiantum capillus-veneris]